MDTIQQAKQKLNRLLIQYTAAKEAVVQERRALWQAKEHAAAVLEAQQLCQQVAEAVQVSAHKQIASVVTRCLQAIFQEEAYEFQIDFSRKRGKTEAKLAFTRMGQIFDPISASGGGMVDVASFALRLACLVLTRPTRRRLLVLDEPFRFVNGKEYQDRVGSLLTALAKEMQVQFVIVSDDEWLKIGKVVELE